MNEATILDLYRCEVDAPRDDHYVHATLSEWRTLTTGDYFADTCALAEALHHLGVGAGDRVLLLADNRPEWHQVDLATLSLGAADVPLYPTLTADQVAYQATDSGGVVAVADSPEQMAKLLAVRDRCPQLRHLVQMDGDCAEGVLPYRDLIDAHRGSASAAGFWARAAEVRPENLASIVYTSGTTGPPKGVMLSHRNLVSNVEAVLPRVNVGRDDLALEFLPLCHVFERACGYAFMKVAASKVYCSPAVVAELIGTIRPTAFASVPRLFERIHATITSRVEAAPPLRRKLFHWAVGVGQRAVPHRLAGEPLPVGLRLKHAVADRLVLSKIRRALGGRLRCAISGGAPLSQHLNEFFHAVGIPIQEGYGLTETSPGIGVSGFRPGENRLGAVGTALHNLEVKLAADGELLVRGPSVTSGYWNDPQTTAEAFDEAGFFKTGDIAHIDADGFIFITDRKKDIIIPAGGKNVAPQPIENELRKSPYIDNAVLIGDRRPHVAALLSPSEDSLQTWAVQRGLGGMDLGSLLREPEVKALFARAVAEVNAQLGRFEQIKKFRVLPRPLSIEGGHLTPTLKVKRKVVEQEFRDLVETMYA